MAARAENAHDFIGRERAIAAALLDAADRVEQTIDKYRGVLDLRSRQIEKASAVVDPGRREHSLSDTSEGYAGDLERYSSELQQHVTAFRGACEDLRAWSSGYATWSKEHPRQDQQPARRFIEYLKLARSATDLTMTAKAAVDTSTPLRGDHHFNRSTRQYFAVLDRYVAALTTLEDISLEMLSRLGADATRTDPADGRP